MRLTWGKGGLPGLYQVGWGKGGVCVRGGHSGAGDGDERDRFGRDPVPVALKRYEVVFVELACQTFGLPTGHHWHGANSPFPQGTG
jgi:hypothetical protein